MTLSELLNDVVQNHHGFMNETTVVELAKLDRLRLVLVRCNGGRFMCPAQDVEHFVALVESGKHRGHEDYVRDVSLPAGDDAFKGARRNHTGEPPPVRASFVPRDCATMRHGAATRQAMALYDGDYGGAFDGFTVTSDADPGL